MRAVDRTRAFREMCASSSASTVTVTSAAGLRNQFMHLPNYSINKRSANFVPNKDANSDDHGNKWSLSALRRCLARRWCRSAAGSR